MAGGSLREFAESTTVHVGSAILVMGGWAAFANRAHGVMPALSAALVQSAASAMVTVSLKTSLEAMSKRLRGVGAFVVLPLVSCTVVLLLLLGVHRLAGTRELWTTIALPYAASSAYAWIYAAVLASRNPR